MSTRTVEHKMGLLSRRTACFALGVTLLILAALVIVPGCSGRDRKPSVQDQYRIYKVGSEDVYMQCGDKRIYLGKAVVHETEEGPTTEDSLRPHEFGTELTSEGLEGYRKEHRD